jgi:glyoxylase-like metal-dependent hydrolase (beta-lactamase superfamily II)
MHRRSFILNTSFTFAALSLANKELLTSLFQDPYKITMLNDKLGIFTERGGTIAFLLEKKGIVVVDAQFPESSKHLIDALRKDHQQPFSLLINTHHHQDHSSGNISFKGLVPHVLAHENSLANQKRNAIANKSEDKQLYPDQTYTNTWCHKEGKEKICLNYFGAGHTNGDSFVHFQRSNVVHCGDLVFNGRHPVVDRGAGANMKSWGNVLEQALQKFDKKTTYVFGHAGAGFDVKGNADDLKRFQDYLEAVLDLVANEVDAGKTKEDILKITSIPGFETMKPDGLNRTLTAAYEELTAPQR